MMTKYCITAVNPKNDDCVQTFNVWENKGMYLPYGWKCIGEKSIYDVCDLLKNGYTVYSAKEVDGEKEPVKLGVPVEIELRIVENNSDYKISEMPSF
jgi:hypothetical protein